MSSKPGLSKSEILNHLDDLSDYVDVAVDNAIEGDNGHVDAGAIANLSYINGRLVALINSI